jgi:pyruvate,water dikinase
MYVLKLEEVDKTLTNKVGGKNASLGELIKAGVRVPPGFAVTTDSYLHFLTKEGIKDRIYGILSTVREGDVDALNRASAEIRSLFEERPLPREVEASIKEHYRELSEACGVDEVPVAVRSSATAEDMPTASFAGQQDTYLWVRGADEVCDKVKACWASLFAPRAINYRLKMGIPHEKTFMSVGVQKMVNAKCAGVMFTLDPLTGDPSRIVIEGNWGVGETVVSGSVTPDRFVVDRVTLEITSRVVSPKTVMLTYDPKVGRAVHKEVPEDKRSMPCLTDEEVLELAKLGKRVHEHYGRAQDIEWAIDADLKFPDSVFLVQSRPETVWSSRKAEPVFKGKTVDDLIWETVFKKR